MAAQTESRRVAGRPVGRILGAVIASWLGHAGAALAFPLIDPTNPDTAPAAADLAAPDAQDLRHQLQMVNGLPPPGGKAGWTILPRLGVEEALTDNILQLHSPRRWDLSTYLAPGIAIDGATRRIQLRLDYSPVLIMNARTGSQNALNQQLNGTATITAIEELAFVDLRAVSGVQSARGGIGGGGTIGAGDITGIRAGSAGITGTTRLDSIQTTSVGISPYLLRQIGDIGTMRVGYSLDRSQYSPVTGFRYLPLPVGSSSQTLTSHEETAQFKTGDYFGAIQDTFDVDFIQSTSSFNSADSTFGRGFGNSFATTSASTRNFITNTVNYAVNHSITINLSGGYEHIKYGGTNRLDINDMTWSAGATLTPNPRSAITFSYGHRQGADSLAFEGRYEVTPRVTLTASYNDTLGTQLENVQNQLNQGRVSANGGLVNGTTGGQLFASTNSLAVQPGVFRFKTLTASAAASFDRDSVTVTLNSTNQVTAGAGTLGQFSSQSSGVELQWIRELRPDLRLASSASYNVMTGSAGTAGETFAFNTGLQYTLNETLQSTLRYTYFRRTAQTTLFNIYENLLILGITKQF